VDIAFKKIRNELAPFVEKIWVFETDSDLPCDDLSTLLPNGRIKIIVPFKSNISMQGVNGPLTGDSSGIFLAGMIDSPIRVARQGKKGTIGIEIKVNAAHRFFNCPLKYFNNGLFSFSDIFGRIASELQQRVADAVIIDEKIKVIEDFLLMLLSKSESIWLIDFAAHEISRTGGLTSIGDLCKDAGYSKRYLDRLFAEHVGLGPKKIACINRFQGVLNKKIVWQNFDTFMETDLYHYYYDQTHFINEFKRFSGLSPMAYEKKQNNLGEIFNSR